MSEVTDTRGRKVTFSYANGRLTAINDLAGGRTYAYGYDSSSRLASFAVTTYGLATDNLNLNATTTFGYDSSDRLSTITDPRGNETRVTYDGAARKVNKIVRVTDKAAGTGPNHDVRLLLEPQQVLWGGQGGHRNQGRRASQRRR